MGDGVAERTKASVVTHTGAGSNLVSRAEFFFGQVIVSGEKCRYPPGMTDTHGCPLKNLPKPHTLVTPTVPSPTKKKTNSLWL